MMGVRASHEPQARRQTTIAEVHPVTMSPLVLCTIANSSLCSASGTLNFAMVSSKSFKKAAHSPSVILRCSWDSRIPAGVCLWATRGPANHLGHIVFEARRADPVMRFANGGVRIQDRVVHNPVNEVIHYGGNGINPAETVIECAHGGLRTHRSSP